MAEIEPNVARAGACNRTDWLVAALLFVALSTIYFATASGITSSNDGSHYALTRTIVANHTFALNQFDDYAEGNDIAITPDGRLYSDRPPGTALLGTLFYAIGGWLPLPLAPLPTRHDPGNPRLLYVLLLPAWAGAATVALLYAFMRELALSRAAALTTAVVFALGTIQWKYSSVLFSHALSGLLVIASLYLAVRLARGTLAGWPVFLLLGALLGYGVVVEYSNGLLVIIVVLFLLWTLRPWTARRFLRTMGPLVAGGMLSAVFLAFYNTVNFGGPLTLSYAYAVNYPWAAEFATTFSYPLLPGLRALLVWGEGGGQCDPTCYNQGLLLLSPVLLLALPGFVPYARRAPRAALLTTAVFLAYLLLFATHFTAHGFTGDGRYLAPFLGLLALPLGFAWEWIATLRQRPLAQALLLLLAYGLFFLSVRNVFLHIGFSYNYTLDLARLDPLIARPANWAYLAGQVFPNAANLPLLWLVEGVVIGLVLIGITAVRYARQRR